MLTVYIGEQNSVNVAAIVSFHLFLPTPDTASNIRCSVDAEAASRQRSDVNKIFPPILRSGSLDQQLICIVWQHKPVMDRVFFFRGKLSLEQNIPSKIVFSLANQFVLFSKLKYKTKRHLGKQAQIFLAKLNWTVPFKPLKIVCQYVLSLNKINTLINVFLSDPGRGPTAVWRSVRGRGTRPGRPRGTRPSWSQSQWPTLTRWEQARVERLSATN